MWGFATDNLRGISALDRNELGSTPSAVVCEGPFLPMDPLPPPFRSVYTTRIAGTSAGAYESLNLALHVGDDPRRVRENRRLVFETWRLDAARAVIAQQIHGSAAVLVDESDAGAGSFSNADTIPGADALVTRTPRLPLMAFSADCLLLALGDPQARVLALLHAGWRGMASGIIENTIMQMREAGADPARLHVSGGPSIGPCCFEVGSDVLKALGHHHAASTLGEKAMLDLRNAARERLLQSGVGDAQVNVDPACTCCRSDLFFSHRRATRNGEKTTGRMAMVVWMQ